MARCGKSCPVCPFIKPGKTIKINHTQTWKINKRFTCETYNCIYILECDKDNCNQRYIGMTERLFKYRLAEHRGYIQNQVTSKATGAHFSLPGHSLGDLSVTIIEQVKKTDDTYRKEREKYHIKKFNTYHSGLNKKE